MTESGNRSRGILLTAGAATCWSAGGLLVRLVDAGVWEIVFWRSLFMALALAAALAVRDGRAALASIRAMGASGVVAVFFYVAGFILFVASVTRTEVAHTLVIMSAAPLVSALLAWPILGEPVRPRTWVTMAVAMAGIGLMFTVSLDTGSALGDAMAALLALVLGCNTVVLRRARSLDMVPAVCVAGLIAAAVTFPLGAPFAVGGRDLAILAVMGTAQLGLGLILFTWGVRHLPAAEVGVLTLLETVLGSLWVWMALGERPGGLALAGGGAVVLALAAHALMGARRSKPPIGLA